MIEKNARNCDFSSEIHYNLQNYRDDFALKLSTIVLHFMRIVYKKFRHFPNFRS